VIEPESTEQPDDDTDWWLEVQAYEFLRKLEAQ
jgi:hypothetical protein